jgi:hypothetical protein
MRAAYQIYIILPQKNFDHICPKHKADASLILPPTFDSFLRVRPQQITQQTFSSDNKKLYLCQGHQLAF